MAVANYSYAAWDKSGVFSPFEYKTREPGEDEILVKVKYCGICHSDIHKARSDWAQTNYPAVTGHEFIAEVVRVGRFRVHPAAEAHRYPEWKVGDIVGVGCLVDSCKDCAQCSADWEVHCPKTIKTYDSLDRTGEVTRGGYGQYVVLNRRFALRIPEGMDYKDAAPLFCAGITTYSPVRQHNLDRGNLRIGVIGLGGLGHMAVQYAAKINQTNKVFVFSRDRRKKELARKLGATKLIPTGGANMSNSGKLDGADPELESLLGTFDYLIDTVNGGDKPMALYAGLLAPRGTWIMVGLPPAKDPLILPAAQLITGNKTLAGSCIGGLKETQEMVDFSFKYNCMPIVEHIKADQINEAVQRVIRGDVMFRFVIDIEESYKDKKI